MAHMNRKAGHISHDDQMQLVVDGHVVPGSNYVDILHSLYTQAGKNKPTGQEHFMRALKRSNVPTSLISNKHIIKSLSAESPTTSALLTSQSGTGGSKQQQKWFPTFPFNPHVTKSQLTSIMGAEPGRIKFHKLNPYWKIARTFQQVYLDDVSLSGYLWCPVCRHFITKSKGGTSNLVRHARQHSTASKSVKRKKAHLTNRQKDLIKQMRDHRR